jgi:hypothetical protein
MAKEHEKEHDKYKYTLRAWQALDKTPFLKKLIVQASDMTGQDQWQPFPIGLNYSFATNLLLLGDKRLINQSLTKEKLLLCALNVHTDSQRRRHQAVNRARIVATLKSNVFLQAHDYFRVLPHYKFVVSPEGNGIDCHRHYETLLTGGIPIVEHNPLIEAKYKGCPILYTTNYSELTQEYLMAKYTEMLDQTFDFACLFLPFYDVATQHTIKTCGNYWMKRLTKKHWYL